VRRAHRADGGDGGRGRRRRALGRAVALAGAFYQIVLQTYFTHRSVSTLDRISNQLTDEHFLYGTTLNIRR
jgi:hypothetical protein